VLHAFGRTEGLPYPNPDGTRDYDAPGPALETAFFGASKLEERVMGMWQRFLRETAQRVGFDIDAML
jgi:hypothetical protein